MLAATVVHVLVAFFIDAVASDDKKPKAYNQTSPQSSLDNPNFIRDRYKNLIKKPEMPNSWNNRYKKPYHPAWMDYCDPYHCGDYFRRVCGLNRANMRFKWFQSQCHLIINNECSTYRGHLKYDLVDTRFCDIYVMDLRLGCPTSCDGEVSPICALNVAKNRAFIFKSRCAMDMFNCAGDVDKYEEIDFTSCYIYLRK